MTTKRPFMGTIFFLLTLLFFTGSAHALTDMGSVVLNGKVKKLNCPVAVVEDRLILIDPVSLEVVNEVVPSGEIKDIAYDEKARLVYVLLEEEGDDDESDREIILVIDPYTSETLDSVEVLPLKGIWVEPVERVLIGLGKGRRDILLFSLSDLSLIRTVHLDVKIRTLEVNPGGGTLVLAVEQRHTKCKKHKKEEDDDEGHGRGHKKKACKDSIEVISLEDGSLQGRHPFREKIERISVDSESAIVAVLTHSGRVYLLDLLTMTEPLVIEADRHTKDILLSGGKVLVTDHKGGSLSVFDAATGQMVESIPVGKRAEWISKVWPYYLVSCAEGVRVLREDLPPEIEAINPGEVQAGAGDVVLSVTGRWFMPGAEVLIDDVAITTTFVSETALRATIPSSYTETPSSYRIKVRNPDGRLSSEVEFLVRVPEPYISTVVLIETDLNSGAMVLEVYGSGFLPETGVYYDGRQRTVTYIKETKLQVELLPEDTQVAGVYSIVAENTDYDGTAVRSNTFEFTVNNPVPVVSSITTGRGYGGLS